MMMMMMMMMISVIGVCWLLMLVVVGADFTVHQDNHDDHHLHHTMIGTLYAYNTDRPSALYSRQIT